MAETVALAATTEGKDDRTDHPPEPLPWLASDRRLTLVALAAVAGVIVLTMGSSLVGLRTLTVTDALNNQEPWRSLQTQDWTWDGTWFSDHVNATLPGIAEFVDRLWDGDIAWWSPYNNGGTPLVAGSAAWVFSPLSWIYTVLPLWLSPAWSHLLVMLVAIGGTVAFLRRLGVSTFAGVVGGLAFATSGFMYIWVLWPHTKTAAFIPWMFWAVERAVQERRASSVVPVALVTTLMYAGHFPAVALWTYGVVIVYGGFRLLALGGQGVARRDLQRIGALILGAVALGLGLMAWQIVPFRSNLGELDLSYRDQTTACHAPTQALGSLVFPRYGSDEDFAFVCPQGEHETEAFAGAMVLGLAGVGLLAPGRSRRGLRTFFVTLAGVTGMLVYLGGPALWFVQQFPVFENNRIMRIRVLMSFGLAVLAAFGVERLRAEAHTPARRRLLAGVAGLLGVAAIAAWKIHDWSDIPPPPLNGWIPVVACVAAAGVLLAVRAPRATLRVGAVAVIPLLVGAEAVGAIQPYWPTGDPDDLYADTETTDYLQEHIGHDRMATALYSMLPNANRVYGLRNLTGRGFYEGTWGDLLRTANGGRLAGVRTLSVIPHMAVEGVESPVLDRLAVRYYVVNSGEPPIYGDDRELRDPAGSSGVYELRPGEPVTIPLDGPARALGFDMVEAPDPGGQRPRLESELLDAEGNVLARGTQRIYPWIEAGPWHLPVAGDGAEGTVAARVTLVDAERPVKVEEYDGSPLAYLVLPEDDGLELVQADATAIYERTTALPRIRWASAAIVEPDADRRLDLLDDRDVPASTVVLSEPGPEPSGAPADVEILEDSGNRIRATVDAAGDGYLVVADALQRGWKATLGGEEVELRDADHAIVAVAVPEGTHEIELSYTPPHQREGLLIAAASALVLVGLALSGLRWRKLGRDGQRSATSS